MTGSTTNTRYQMAVGMSTIAANRNRGLRRTEPTERSERGDDTLVTPATMV